MTNLLRDAMSYLTRRMRDVAAETVTYRRGADSVEVKATIGSTDYVIEQFEGNANTGKTTDFLITATELTFDAGVTNFLPRRGDLIESAHDGGVLQTYKVTSPFGENCYKPSDEFGYTLRVYTEVVLPNIAP